MLKNITKMLVEQELDTLLEEQNCCKCQKCREDIMAYALNRLPSFYVSTDEGELYGKAKSFSAEYEFDLMKQLVIAINLVSNNPRHI